MGIFDVLKKRLQNGRARKKTNEDAVVGKRFNELIEEASRIVKNPGKNNPAEKGQIKEVLLYANKIINVIDRRRPDSAKLLRSFVSSVGENGYILKKDVAKIKTSLKKFLE